MNGVKRNKCYGICVKHHILRDHIYQFGKSGGKRSPVCRIFQRQQRRAAPTAGNLREEPVLNRVELGAIRRIMNKKKPDTQFVGKIHKVLLDDSVCAGVRSSSVAQDDKGMCIRVLLPQMILPYALDVVAHEPGGVVADSHRHIPHIFGDIVDAVRNNLSVGEGGEVVVKGPECTIGQGFSVTLEVPQHLLLLRVNADNGKPNGFRLLADGRDASELFVPVLDILQGEVLIEGTLPKYKRIKNLADVVTVYIITGLRQFIHNLGMHETTKPIRVAATGKSI